MANNKTTNQPGSNNLQPNDGRTRNQNAHDTGGQRPNGERTMTNANKSKQGPEEEHNVEGKTKSELAEERGGHGHSGHSDSRNGSRKH
ncbi:hypothetical protein [Spirosoma endbachense]|uniref:Uncharacterized protein n=1 Tax=Spirosoma endbachense TaxID=2666025 RepID=A0A6P1VV51_9BACT|nr:hypothetical protein [Spirosoma endbachense]QHV95952.1 hypothetical protein GJR95_13455 [Spirosoma endbachense]